MNTTTPASTTDALLGTDLQASPLHRVNRERRPLSYTPFGHASQEPAQVIGFTGQMKEQSAGCYLLGNGYRAYSPSLMRFATADELSPFDQGGINAYAYCGTDPVNRTDPSGHSFLAGAFKGIKNALGRQSTKRLISENKKLIKHIRRIDAELVRSNVSVSEELYATIVQRTSNGFKPLIPPDGPWIFPDSQFGIIWNLNETLQSRGEFVKRLGRNNYRVLQRGKLERMDWFSTTFREVSGSHGNPINRLFREDPLPTYAQATLLPPYDPRWRR